MAKKQKKNKSDKKNKPTRQTAQAFGKISDEQQSNYEREIRLEHGPDLVNESRQNWNRYTEARRETILAEGNAIYQDIARAIDAGEAPEDTHIQAIMQRWHEHLRYFYEPSLDLLRGLGELYNTHPDFITNFRKIHTDLAPVMRNAINQYVDDLEDSAIRRLIAQDQDDQQIQHDHETDADQSFQHGR